MIYSRRPALQRQIEQARDQLVHSRLLVIWGPTGCGKTHLVRSLHADMIGAGPLVFQEAAGLDSNRFESQLFGHLQGSFSGAVRDFHGLLGAAGEGTLCIEGLEALSSADQAKLLRFLQDKRYRPVGAVKERQWKGRLVFTAQRSLAQLREDGSLRDDLYFRLNGRDLALPPPAKRPEDFQDLCDALVNTITKEILVALRIPTRDELIALQADPPEGNLHGLRNLLQAAMIQNCAPIELQEKTPPEINDELPDTGSLPGDLEVLEGRLLQRALRKHRGTRTELAEKLGISRRKLMYMLKAHRLN
ncbi:MAG: sigma 54-interacting transcriptional regulator [Acidobacteriota bacterium]|nr:sigma 54-interacting transcriptional regulator [Acidobacteriota bacterium]